VYDEQCLAERSWICVFVMGLGMKLYGRGSVFTVGRIHLEVFHMAFMGETLSTSNLHPIDRSEDGLELLVCTA